MNVKKWNTIQESRIKNKELSTDEILDILFKNRGLKTKKEINQFINPKLEDVTIDNVGINKLQLKKAVRRIKKAIDDKEQIIVFGDYDVDGICGTAILWEVIHSFGARVLPYIPHRIDEGYGLSIKGIENVKSKIENCSLIITVDNGIVANEAVDFAKKQGIDVIITDHHVLPVGGSKKLPKAHSIVHTTKLCGTGVAYLLSKEIKIQPFGKTQGKNSKIKHEEDDHLALVALATVADLVPLTGVNRTLLKFGLEKLKQTKRIGILELLKEAFVNQQDIRPYEIGHIIAPRLNATGRMEYAMDSLRLICTKDKNRAEELARKIGSTNRERQILTQETVLHALEGVRNQGSIRKLLFIAHESYQPGVIGLVAGRLVEEFYRPAIVVSKGEKYSKASARSISGFNIIEFIRSASDLLVDAGGHPMAAGFTVETEKLILLQQKLEESVLKLLDEDDFLRTLRIDCEIPLSFVDENLYCSLQKLAPFGMANPEPTFVSRNVIIENIRFVGRDQKHLKLRFSCHPELGSGSESSQREIPKPASTLARGEQVRNDKVFVIEAIAFGMGERASELHIGDSVDIVYTIDMNKWNGNQNLQLKIKDIGTE